jgi:iron complex outermembrane receptor protein
MVRAALSIVSACSAAFLGLLFAPPVHADQLEEVQVKDVIVSSTRLPDAPVDARALPAKVTVITAEDIKKSGAKTVQEAIQWATGIVMYDQVGNAFQQTIDLRGYNGQPVQATSVFVDGMRMNEPDFNTVNFDLIPYETIERIEIIPGAAAIYGKNAMGGVINIITKRGNEKRQTTAETMFGSFQRERYTLNTSGPIGRQLDYFANFSRETEEGFRRESDARIARFFGKLGYRPTDDTDITLSYTYVKDKIFQAGTLPISEWAINPTRNFTPGDFFDSETNVLRLTGRQKLPMGFSLNVNGFYRQLGQEQFTKSQPFFPGGAVPISTNLIATESRGGVAQLTHEVSSGGLRNAIVLGTEFTRNDFGNRRRSVAGTFISNGRGSTDEDIVGLYAQDTLHLTPQLIVNAGVRYDRNQIEFSDEVTTANSGNKVFSRTNPRAGMTYLATPDTSVYFNYSQGFRAPTFNELFSLGQLFGSNANLKPVRSKNYEVGLKTKIGAWGEAAVTLFHADVSDEILQVCGDRFACGVTTFASNQNIEKSRRRGIETTFKAKYNRYFDGVINYTFTEATIQSDLTLNPFFFDAFGGTPYVQHVKKGSSFPLVPKNRLSVTGNYHPDEGWTVSVTGLYVSTQFMLNDEQNTQPRLPGYFVLNSRVAYERSVPGGKLGGFLMLNNMLDQKYSTSGIIAANNLTGNGAVERFVMPSPGMAIYGGLSFKFDGP